MATEGFMAKHNPLKFATGLSARLAARSRHVCAFPAPGTARSCGLPDIAELQKKVVARLKGEDRTTFARELEKGNLEQALSRLRRIAALLTGEQKLDGFTARRAKELDSIVCKAIVKELDISWPIWRLWTALLRGPHVQITGFHLKFSP